jgi:hypothetical protein
MRRTYVLGSKPSLRVSFKDPLNGRDMDPDSVTLKYKGPTDLTTTSLTYGTDAELIRDSVGNYHCNVLVDEAGIWVWTFRGETLTQATVVSGDLSCTDPGI